MRAERSQLEVAIIGAGLSGIGMAAHMRMLCPQLSFTLLERRDSIGGTWDLFRYPGVRSDSDMHTLGFVFEPWVHEKSIADGPAILEYLERITRERGIAEHIRFGTTVQSAAFDSEAALWRIGVEDADGWHEVTARFLYLGSGYYDYDDPHDPQLPGLENFGGEVLHPQFWPRDLDYAGRRVVVIGSGATAVTMVPAMADEAAHVTMLQRTPTWMGSRPATDAVANFLRRHLPEKLAYRLTRAKNIFLQDFFFKRARRKPEQVSEFLTKKAKEAMGAAYDPLHFTPPYNPWEQRLCLVPDDDFFHAVRDGKASVATGHIAGFDADGVTLKSGEHLPADILVTATGLQLAMGGKIALSIDGAPLNQADHFFYRNCMLSNVPNLAMVFGYLNASWTLRSDSVAEYVCRVLNALDAKGADIVYPLLPDPDALEEDDIFDFSSGYLQRAKHLLPKSAPELPWRLNQDYRQDRRDYRARPIEDGILRFEHAGALAEAAE